MNQPFQLNLTNHNSLVIGGGNVAARKTGRLLSAGSSVTVISPSISKSMMPLIAKCQYIPKAIADIQEMEKLTDTFDLRWSSFLLLVAATSDKAINLQISKHLNQTIALHNVAGHPELNTINFPSMIERDPLTIAISTNGASPIFARKMKATLESDFDERYGTYLKALSKIREDLLISEPDPQIRKEKLEAITEYPPPR